MANRYLVGSGNRDLNNPVNWSSVSGGTGADALGGELITNAADRDFSSNTGFWNLGTGVSISSGVCNINTSSTVSAFNKNFLTVGKWYKVKFDCVLSSGALQVSFGASFQNILTSGSKTIYIYASGPAIIFYTLGATLATIDNISIEEILTLPTLIDNAIFDANSGTGTITQSAVFNCADFTCENIGALTLSNSAFAFNVFGSLTLHSNLTVSFTSTGYLYFKATTTGKNITSNGNVQGWNRIYFDGVGGEWTNQDDWNIAVTNFRLANGHWNTNGKTITNTGVFNTDAGTKTLTLGASTFNIGTWSNVFNGGFTLNADTSTVQLAQPVAHNLNCTFYNLTLISYSNVTLSYRLQTGCTVTNVLTINGVNNSNFRTLLASITLGTPITIIVNGSIVASNVDFRDITLAGTANRDLSAITGGSGDCGGNSGITFTPAINCYFKHTSGSANWSDATKWVTTDGGTTQARVPLPQDDALFTANSFTEAAIINVNVPRIGGLNMEGVNQIVTFNLSNGIDCYGNFVLGENIVTLVISLITLRKINGVFKSFGKQLATIYAYGNYINQSNILLTSSLYVFGNFDFNDYNVDILLLDIEPAAVCFLGNGEIIIRRLSSNPIVIYGTVYAENSTIILVPASGSSDVTIFNLDGKQLNNLKLSGSHTGAFVISNTLLVNHFSVDKNKTLKISGGKTLTVAKTSIQGTPSEPVVLTSTNTTPFNLVHSGSGYHQWDYVNISYCNATANRFYAGERSTNGGNNTGVLFRNYLLRDNIILKRWIKKINF